MDEVAACRSVLIEVLTILGKELDSLVIVGGWVPELAFPNRGHIGSLDVDLALDATKLKPLIYESIRQRLIQSGYQQLTKMPNRFFRMLKDSKTQIKVDLITGEFPPLAGDGSHLQIQDLSVWKARGVDLAFVFQQTVKVEGVLPDGGHNVVIAKRPTIAAYLCIKAITMSERKKEKDAYDICFCIDNYPEGYKALAKEFAGKLENEHIKEGIAILRAKFARLDSIGPVWAAQVESNANSGSEFETVQRRAFELVNALLREIDGLVVQ